MQLLENIFMNVFKIKLGNELTILAKEISLKMKEEINKLPKSGSYDSVGESKWREDVKNAIDYIVLNETLAFVANIGLVNADEVMIKKGLLINYGMGLNLDTSNPYLQEYLSSKAYDNKRQGYAVFTRPGEFIYDYETGGYYKSVAKTREEIPYFRQNPAHFVENGIIEIQQRLNLIFENIMNQIDISKFVI